MKNKHIITSQDKWFLDKHMKDPVAQEPFKIGDSIVICAKCRTAHYESSWNMNSNKCCSTGCNHNKQLVFKSFSPAIFQPKTTHHSYFNIIVKKLPLRERLKLFNGYPIADTITILIPIFLVALLIFATEYQAISTYNMTKQLRITQERLLDFSENNLIKFEHLSENPRVISPDFGEINYKLEIVFNSFKDIKVKAKLTDISHKSNSVISNIASTSKRAERKISRWFDSAVKFLSN